jgi:hypothetical protein
METTQANIAETLQINLSGEIIESRFDLIGLLDRSLPQIHRSVLYIQALIRSTRRGLSWLSSQQFQNAFFVQLRIDHVLFNFDRAARRLFAGGSCHEFVLEESVALRAFTSAEKMKPVNVHRRTLPFNRAPGQN